MAKEKSAAMCPYSENRINNCKMSEKRFNKKGAALLLTIVVISLISILSTLVLSLALSAYRASVQSKWADEDFYYCEECLDDVYGVVVAITNDIFLDNYKQVSSMFTSSTPDIINKTFREGIRLDLRSMEISESSSLYQTLNQTVDAVDNDGNVVGELVVSYNDSRYNNDTDLILQDFEKGKYVFKDVKVEYWNTDRSAGGENQKKFYSSVTTDIVIYIPDLSASVETNGEGSLSYVLVSKDDLSFNGTAYVTGNVYAGENLNVSSDSNVTFFSNYVTVCNQLENNGKFTVTGASAAANIWCKDILMNSDNASALIAGNLYVNDDLEINGDNCAVQLSGKYYGYGDGTSTTSNKTSNSGTGTTMNSAILVNGKGALLDMMSLEELVISGHSFFPVDGIEYKGAESLATIVSQSIYMVDEKYIDFSTRTVSVGDKSIDFSSILLSGNKTLIDVLEEGYTLLTGGVDLSVANVTVGDNVVTESIFASDYLADASQMVTIGVYETGGEKYCSLYWNFATGYNFKSIGADIVHQDYIVDEGVDPKIGIADVYLKDVYLYQGGSLFSVDGENPLTVGALFDNKFSLTDSYAYTYNFDLKYGSKLPEDINTATFKKEYLNENEPVKAVIVETDSEEETEYKYVVYLQWNFDSSKVSTKSAGDAFISACINSGLVDGFLEKFMDGGYIEINGNASVNTTADLYEYIVGDDGYAAKKFGASSQSLFNSSVYSKNLADTYKWYMTTLVPEKFDPFSSLTPFDNSFNIGDEYSVFDRNSYYLSSTGVKESTKYLNFNTIDTNVSTYEIVTTDGVHKNLMINGDLAVTSSGWTAAGVSISPFLEGIIFVDGDVTIESDILFSGMIISNGEIVISAGKYVADVELIEGCLETLKEDIHSNWWPLVSDEFYTRKTESGMGTSSLNAANCIKYENWTRNRDENA